mgnify:CR=1 FL=1
MNPSFVNYLNLIGSILSIISFFPIMGATVNWLWKQTYKKITLSDKNGQPFTVKVKRKYLNNRDLTPLVQLKYGGDVNVAQNVRLSILKATLDADRNIKHIDSSSAQTDIVVS